MKTLLLLLALLLAAPPVWAGCEHWDGRQGLLCPLRTYNAPGVSLCDGVLIFQVATRLGQTLTFRLRADAPLRCLNRALTRYGCYIDKCENARNTTACPSWPALGCREWIVSR